MRIRKIGAALLSLIIALAFAADAFSAEFSVTAAQKYYYSVYINASVKFSAAVMNDKDKVILSAYNGCDTVASDRYGRKCEAVLSDVYFNGVVASYEELTFGKIETNNSPMCGEMNSFTLSFRMNLKDSYTDPAELLDIKSLSVPLAATLPAYENMVFSFTITDLKVKAFPVNQVFQSSVSFGSFNGGKGLNQSQQRAIINSAGDVTVTAYPDYVYGEFSFFSLYTDLKIYPVYGNVSEDYRKVTFKVPISYLYDAHSETFFRGIFITDAYGNPVSLSRLRVEISEKTDASANLLSIDRSSIILNKNLSYKLTANKNADFSSSDESVATVDSTGKVTAVGTGSAVITVSVGGENAYCSVKVISSSKPASYVYLPYTQCVARVGKKYTLKAQLPTGSTDSVFWSSSDSSVAAIDPISGTLVAYKPGTAVITAYTSGGKSVSCTVTVKLPD